MNEILLNGISFDQLQESIKTIVSAELKNAVSELTTKKGDRTGVDHPKGNRRDFGRFIAYIARMD